MTYDDEIENEIGYLRHVALQNDTSEEMRLEAYLKMEKLIAEQMERAWTVIGQNFNDFEEALKYDILERYLDFGFAEHNYGTAEGLAQLLQLDAELKRYCEDHINGEGLFGMIKYKERIVNKRELIKDALLLCK